MHLRGRYVTDLIEKKVKIWPIVGILGARQTGKSTLLSQIIGKEKNIPYFTLDRPEILKQIKSKTESFILSETNDFTTPVILDEAQKSIQLFDVLKVLADERKKRGIIIITGSVNFSAISGIIETLTGRIGICRIFPMTVGEIQNKHGGKLKINKRISESANLIHVESWLERGGMPGICWLSDRKERASIIEEWLQSVCYRDLQQLRGSRFDGSVAMEILSLICHNPETTPAKMAIEIGVDSRTIKKHLTGLENLYVINKVKPLKKINGAGFERYFILDAGIAAYLGASNKTRYTIFLINQLLSQYEYTGQVRPQLFYYSSRGKTKIDLITKINNTYKAYYLSDKVEISNYITNSLTEISKRKFFASIEILAPIKEPVKISKQISLNPYLNFC